EIEACLMGQARGALKILNNLADLLVAQHRIIVRNAQSRVQYRVVVEDAWLRAVVNVGATVPARMSQLQTNYQARVRADGASVLGNQGLTKPGEICVGVPANNKLIGLGATVHAHRNCFAS